MDPQTKAKIRKFFITAAVLYIGWFTFYELWFKPQTDIDEGLVALIIRQGVSILNLFGFQS